MLSGLMSVLSFIEKHEDISSFEDTTHNSLVPRQSPGLDFSYVARSAWKKETKTRIYLVYFQVGTNQLASHVEMTPYELGHQLTSQTKHIQRSII